MGAYYPKTMPPPDEPSLVADISTLALRATSELPSSQGAAFLVLGAYGEGDKQALVKEHLDERTDATALTVEDSRFAKTDPTDGIRVLADVADYVVLVDDGDVDDGTMFELGTLLTNNSTYEKTFILVEAAVREQMDSSLKVAVYDLFERAGRLYVWDDESDLREIAESLPSLDE